MPSSDFDATSRTRSRIARFAAIPVFAWLYLRAGDGAAWGAGLFFAGAALTDQVDGYLARRWDVHSAFGKVADPLADRLMIGTAVVLMWASGRIPLVAARHRPRTRSAARPRVQAARPARLRAGGDLSGQACDLGPVRGARLRARDGRRDGVAARLPLDRHRAGARRSECSTSSKREHPETRADRSSGRDAGEQPECKLSS